VYTGTETRIYPGYQSVDAAGGHTTLIGHPGAQPVRIRRGGGNDALPEIPQDGMWSEYQQQAEVAKATAKTKKVVS
jgi:hypothetical protein